MNYFSALKWCRDLRSNGFITAIIDRQKSNAVISIFTIPVAATIAGFPTSSAGS
ncbi:MAG: hypothetical protein KKG96_00770 [Proteobacteria bacterium]|nr:hypothetical protein [Pseudomonadota bacterium]